MVSGSFERKRHSMVAEQVRARGIKDKRLLAVMMEIPRHRFVPSHMSSRAYDDGPLPIGENQTISQPYIVAEMTEALMLSGSEKVLEIGTGSGYQTAILCRLAREVVSVERIRELQATAESVLGELSIGNVEFRSGDGSLGVPDEAPFDRILVTAAAPRMPPPLFEQLAESGIIVMPIGSRWEQELFRIRKRKGKESKERMAGCRFVPLIGKHGFTD